MKRDCYICGGDGFVSEAVRDTRSTGTTTRCPGCDGEGRVEDNGQLDRLQARYDRKVAQRRRLLAYHDECPDGDRRKYDAEQELKELSNSILKIEQEMGRLIDGTS